jgi:hypothetical protein
LRKKSAARFWGLSRGWSAKKAQRIQWDTDFFPRGTGSSNPSPSTGESTANLSFRADPAQRPTSKGIRADDFPAMALVEFGPFLLVDRAALRKCFDEAAGLGRGIQK